MQPKVSIIVLNWNGKNHTVECLNSLSKLDYSNYEVILVDNGSSDGSVDFLKSKFPNICLIENKRNLGFAEGNNVGVRHAMKTGADYVLLLNNDAVVDGAFLKELVLIAERDEKVVLVGPKIYNYYEKNIIESAGYSQSILKSKTFPIGYREEDKGQYDEPKEVDFISGCAMLVKKNVVKDYGVFDSDFFAYCEDQDLCYSVTKRGDKIMYAPKSRIWHKVSASTGGYKSPISVYLFTRNRIRFVLKQGTLFEKTVFFTYFFLYYVPAFTAYSAVSNPVVLKSFYRAIFSFIFNNLKLYEFKHYGKQKVGINARYIQRKITGIEKYIQQSLSALSKTDKSTGYVLFLCKDSPAPQVSFRNNFKKYFTDFPTHSTLARILWEQFWLSGEIKKQEISLFHGTSFVLPFFKPCKYLLTIYDLSYIYYPESYTFFNRLYYKLLLKHSINSANRIITISKAAKKEIMSEFNVPDKKIEIIYPGFDDSFGQFNKDAAKEFIRKNYSIASPFFVFVGSLIPRKNLVRVIEAMNKLKSTLPNHKLVVVGKKGWLYDEIFETVNRLKLTDTVIFTSYVQEQDLPFFYNAADALVFASLHEGFGIPLLEAMACGCPVITSNKSSMPEVAGDAALFVNPLDVTDISNAMRKIATDQSIRKELIAKGLQRVKLFSWDTAGEQLSKVYAQV